MNERERNEILRMELRLNNRRKISETLRRIGVNPKSTQFDNLFHKEIAKRCLIYFWDKMIVPSQNLILISEDDIIVLYTKIKSLGFSDTKALNAIGLLNLIKNDGVRTFKQMKNKKGNAFYRAKKTLNAIDGGNTYLFDVFNYIKLVIVEMASIRDLEKLKL